MTRSTTDRLDTHDALIHVLLADLEETRAQVRDLRVVLANLGFVTLEPERPSVLDEILNTTD